MEQSEEEQYQLAIMADLKNEIKKYLSRLGLMTSFLKIEDEQLDLFVQFLREEGLARAISSIEKDIPPRTLLALRKPFEEPYEENFGDIFTLRKKLVSKAQLCKISQFKELVKLFERRIFERNDYYQLRKDLLAMIQEIFDKDLENFLSSYIKVGFFDRLEFYYIAKTDKKIAEELERNNFQTPEKNRYLQEMESEARQFLENFSIEIDLVAQFLQNLNLETLLAELQEEIAPNKFNTVESRFRDSSIIANNLSALENIARHEEFEAQKLEVFYEIVQRIRGHVFKNPKGNTLEVLLENFLKKPDLKEFVSIIEDLIPPKHFEVIETNIQEDIKLQGLIEKYRKLLFGDNANDLEKNDERNTRMKIFQLEQKLSKSLDYYRHKDLTEEVWKQVVDILKDELNLEEVLRVLEEEIPPVDFQELKEDISQDKDLSRVLMELDKLTREGKRSNTLHIRTPGEDGLAQSPGKIIDFNRTNSLSKSPNSVDVLDKIRTIVTDIALPHIDFKSFNVVSFRPTPEEQTRIVQDWIQNLNDPSKFRELLPIYFNLLKRSEDWSGLQENVNSVISDKAKRRTLDFVHSKFLFYLLMVSADNELRARLLQLYSTYSPVPLKYLKWPTHQQVDNNLLEYEYNEQLYYNIKPSLGVFSFGIGQRAVEKMGKSTILNKIFMTAFATDVNPEFHSGTIDIDLDMKFRPSRNFCIADAHGRFRLAELPAFLGLFKIFIIHVHSEDLKDEGAAQDLKYLCTSIQNTKSESYFNIIIRDSSLAMDVVDDFETLQKEYKPLEILSSTLKQDHFQVLAVNTLNSKGDKAQLSQLIYQKLQKKILTSVQQFQNVISIDKKTFAEKFLWSIGQDKEISKVHKSIQNFIDELKKYSDNFFDQKVFPYRYLLSTLRRAQSVLRIAKNEDEIKKAKSVVAEVESQLKQVKATKIMKLFTELLCQPNSYLILMEISKEIKLIVDSSCETLLTQKAEFATQLKEQAGQTGKELKNWMSLIETELHTRSLSIEVLWRELLALYTYNEKEVTDIMKVDIVSKIQEFLDKGEPFELIDGDNLQFNEALLEKLFTRMKGKMCNVSVIGPQSSGKSTLLNYLFGCQFVSSVGRCTRGIYLSLLKVHNNPDYDYLMILDTEGLQSTEKNDEEFDKKITLFCLAVSQIIVLNVKGEIHAPMKSLLMICSLSLSEIEKAKIEQPAFYYVFNQNPSSNKSPFMTQIGSMMQEVMESTEQVSAAAEILRPNEQNIHVFGIAYKISKIEEDSGKGVWTDWSYMEPQSSFAIESSDLARVITRKIQARITSRKGNQSTLGFVEWSGLAKEIWKTIDMFPNIVNFSEFRTLKQEKELLVYCAQILEDKKEKLSQLRREGKLTLDNLDEECKEIKSEIEEEIMEIRLKYQYDYDQTRKWIRDSQGRIDSHRSEILVALNKDVLQDRIQQEQRKGFKEISERISESLLDPALRGSKEKAISKFNQIWKKYIEDNLSEVINIEVYDEEMWKVLTQVYTKETPDFPDLPTDLVKKLKSSINPDSDKGFNENKKELKLLTDGILSEVKALGIQGNLLQEDEKNEAFLKDIYIKYRQPAFYLSLPNYLSPTLIVKYINIKDLLKNNVDWDMFKQDLFASVGNNYVSKGLNIAENILSFFNKQAAVVLINAIQEGYTLFKSTQNHKIFDNIMSVLLAFAPFGYLPDGYLVTDIKDKLHEGPLTQEKLKELLKHYTSLDRLFCPTENPKFDSEQSVPPIKYFKNAIIETKKIENKEIDEALKEMNHFIDRSYDFTVLKNHTWVFTSKNPTYEEGLKFTVNPYNQNIARSKASENLKDLITSQTDWQKYLEDVCTDIIKEVDVKASYLKQSSQENAQEAYHKDISSFSVDLVKNLVKTVTAKINQLDKEILRCGHKLDRAARGRIHFYSLLITWKILSFASKKRLMDPIEKIKKDKDKWQAYFVSSVNNNLHEKSTSFADRIITEYIENIKQAALRGKIVPKAEEAMRAKKSDFNVEKIQKSLDDTILLADSGQSQKVLEYVFNQNQHFEKQFEKVWSDHYSPLVKNQMKNYKEIVVSHLESTLKTISGLYDFFKNQNKKKKNVMPLDMFEIRDSENQIINIDSDLTIEQMGNNNNELVEFWSVASFELFTQYCTDQVSEKWVYTHENKKYTAKVKGLNKALKPILLINFKKGSSLSEKENQIPLLYVFLEKLQEILIAEINIISTTDLKWGYATIGLDILYQTYKNASVGCTESCPACGRKCDRLGDNHRHRCENGHQIRGMHGIKQGSSLSAKTCDEIKPESQLQIDQQAGKIKWQEFVKRFPEWDFTPYDPKNPPEAIFKFKNCWKLHGLEFCRHYSQLYGQDIRYAPVLEVDSYHFILILDGSGSMKGKPWEDAVSGAKNFLNKVKEIESNLKGVSVSLIVFNDKAQTLAKYEQVGTHLIEKLVFPGGGTNFDAPLQNAYQLIEGNTKFDKHVLLFYTDGGANYPGNAMQKILNYGDKSKISFYALSAEKNPVVLSNIANQFQAFSVGEVKPNITPDMLVSALPEILNSMFHQV